MEYPRAWFKYNKIVKIGEKKKSFRNGNYSGQKSKRFDGGKGAHSINWKILTGRKRGLSIWKPDWFELYIFFLLLFFFLSHHYYYALRGGGGGGWSRVVGGRGGKGQQQSSVITLFYVLLVTRVQGSPDVLREFRTFPWRSWCRQNTWLTIRRPLAPHQTPEWTMTLRMDKPLRKWKVSSETPTRSTGSGNPGSSVLGACQKHDITKGKGKKLRYR